MLKFRPKPRGDLEIALWLCAGAGFGWLAGSGPISTDEMSAHNRIVHQCAAEIADSARVYLPAICKKLDYSIFTSTAGIETATVTVNSVPTLDEVMGQLETVGQLESERNGTERTDMAIGFTAVAALLTASEALARRDSQYVYINNRLVDLSGADLEANWALPAYEAPGGEA